MNDEYYMQIALEMAIRGTAYVSPNPRVGAVIVKDGEIIAKSWHKEFGESHAEINAINQVEKEKLIGSTMYVTLEPCNHQGKTPPCVPAIIESGIEKVVIGTLDPNPLVSGQGMQALMEAGIDVIVGVLEEECKWINRAFFKYIQTGFPYIICKIAQSLNGCIATSNGQSKWITCEESRKRTHQLRSEVDAVLIGRRTAAQDNPELTVRFVAGKSPMSIILDTNLTLPLGLKKFIEPYRNNTIVCCSEKASTTRKAENLRVAGVKIITSPLNEEGKIDIKSAIEILTKQFSFISILVEGGASIYSSFLKKDLIDELHIFIAPIIIGDGINAFSEYTTEKLEKAGKFKTFGLAKSGDDIHLIFTK